MRVHRRQDARKALREHGFACARRADHEHAVAACRCNFQRSLGRLLAFDFAHIGRFGAGLGIGCLEDRPAIVVGLRLNLVLIDNFDRGKPSHHIQQMLHTHHARIGHEARLFSAAFRKHQNGKLPLGLHLGLL